MRSATHAPLIAAVRVPPSADGGTRTAAISGAWVALRIACEKLLLSGAITKSPLIGQVAAISCGVFQGTAVLDLDYDEDSAAALSSS